MNHFLRSLAASGLLLLSSTLVPAAERTTPSGTQPSKSAPASKARKADAQARVDLNTADQTELEGLPGVGPDIAKAIIAARPFKSVGELESVKGIGPEKMRELRPLVSARTPVKMDSKGSARSMEKKSDRAVTKSATKGADVAGAPTGRMDNGNNSERRSSTATTHANGPKVNLNTATKEELEALPEIGPVKAQAIIEARPFKSPEDVMRVSGIKEATYEAIRDRISVK